MPITEGQPIDLQVYTFQKSEDSQEISPYDDWYYGIDKSMRVRITKRMLRVKEQGNLGDHRWLTEGLLEIRIDLGPGYRIYCADAGEQLLILLVGGDKSDQQDDIKTAQEYWTEYQSRKEDSDDKTKQTL